MVCVRGVHVIDGWNGNWVMSRIDDVRLGMVRVWGRVNCFVDSVDLGYAVGTQCYL